jgi:hypothetical protein
VKTTLKLKCLRETELARWYEHPNGKRQWVPRSVCPRVVKLGDRHEVTIEDWWLKQNPFDIKPQDQANLL